MKQNEKCRMVGKWRYAQEICKAAYGIFNLEGEKARKTS